MSWEEQPLEPERYELFAGPAYQFGLGRREFFKVAGAGLMVVCALPVAEAQAAGRQRGRGGGRGQGGAPAPQDISARLHVGEDGTVTLYSGKTEVGQNVRTMLAQAVAEELRVPLTSIHVVLADTERVPDDGGTSGSRSTPSTVPQVRRVAAATRELLKELAAEQWQVDRNALQVSGGKVSHAPSGRTAGIGELTKGQKLVKPVPEGVTTTPPERWEVFGKPALKAEARALVTGAHRYASDVKRPGMLVGRVVRPAAYGAKLAAAETRSAEGLPGVVVVRDGDFLGVAAPDEQQAERAAAAVRAEWQTTPQPGAKELFELLKGSPQPPGDNAEAAKVAEALVAAPHRLEATYTVAYIAHAPLEPRAAVAEWDGDGKLTVWTGTQQPFRVRGELAQAFRLPPERVRVIVPDTGSGYGGKHSGECALEAARLAKAAGKPVRLVWSREEEFTWAYFRPAGVIDVRGGVGADGRLAAWEQHNYNSGASSLRTPYEVNPQRSEFHNARSPLKQGSYRALASTANTFARECHMDDLARAAGVEPLAFRLKNLKDARVRAVLEAAAERFGWQKARSTPQRGFGIAAGTDKGGYVATCAEVAIEDGRPRVVRAVTAFECGAVLNPKHLENQVEGAVVMGLGGALFEAIDFADGRILNPRFSRYRVPRFGDVPTLETVLVDRRDLPSAGAGECPLIAIAPAVGNAICAATGVRLKGLPMLPTGKLPDRGA